MCLTYKLLIFSFECLTVVTATNINTKTKVSLFIVMFSKYMGIYVLTQLVSQYPEKKMNQQTPVNLTSLPIITLSKCFVFSLLH